MNQSGMAAGIHDCEADPAVSVGVVSSLMLRNLSESLDLRKEWMPSRLVA